jgi:hypothetical protein
VPGPSAHIFVSQKMPSYAIRDEVPQFERFVPGFEETLDARL